MKEGFTFNKVSLMFLRKVIFKNFGGGGENRKEPDILKLKRSRKFFKMIFLFKKQPAYFIN